MKHKTNQREVQRMSRERRKLVRKSLEKYSKSKLKKQLKDLLERLMDVRYPDRESQSYLDRLEERVDLLEAELLKR